MTKEERAKIFMPFDALTGFKKILKEKEKVKVAKIELAPESAENLSLRLTKIKPGMMIKIIYYSKGEYLEKIGMVTKIDTIKKELIVVKQKIKIDDIYMIDLLNEEEQFINLE